jgi:hypothetical protein
VGATLLSVSISDLRSEETGNANDAFESAFIGGVASLLGGLIGGGMNYP